MIYDAHCHLDLMDNMSGIIAEMQNSDISLFAVGTTPKAYDREVQFCRNNPHIKVGLGMHPQLISSGYDDMKLFKELFDRSHYIGEVGLDFSKEYIQTNETQMQAFRDIVKLCEQCGEKVVSIHSLKSANTIIEILSEYKTKRNNKYIFH
jgi:TatD DNase family protein